MQINASLSAAANLLALINATNEAQTLTAAQITIAVPAVKADSGDGRNTSVLLTAVEGQGYSGTQTANYTRRGLADSVAAPSWGTTADSTDTLATILARIVAQNGLVASEVTLTGDLTNPGVGETSTLTLDSNAGSLLYVDGSTEVVTLTWQAVPLATAIGTPNLTGFDAFAA